jgi:hypothetical protein
MTEIKFGLSGSRLSRASIGSSDDLIDRQNGELLRGTMENEILNFEGRFFVGTHFVPVHRMNRVSTAEVPCYISGL